MNPTMPMPAFVIRFSPQVCLNNSPDRFTAAIGPMPSNTSTGRTRNVTTDHATPARLPTMRPKIPPRCSTARSTTDTVALTIAQGKSTCERALAARIASLTDTGSPWNRLFAANTSAALKKTTM